jgi:glutathione peroxidase
MRPNSSAVTRLALGAIVALAAGLHARAFAGPVAAHSEGAPVSADSLYAMKTTTLGGKPADLSTFAGKVTLVVNVASQCGFTPQYKGLEALHEELSPKGFSVLGFPSNEFGGQEPGSAEEIQEFCKKNYGVTFDMLEKVSITGKEPAPLYKLLTSKDANAKTAGQVKWNFTKFLIGRNGEIVARYEPAEKPDSDKVVKAIEATGSSSGSPRDGKKKPPVIVSAGQY